MDLHLLRVSASGLIAQQHRVDVIGNNLANLQTPGFRAVFPHLADLPYGTGFFAVAAGDTSIVTAVDGIGEGVALAATLRSTAPGSPVRTGRALDVALPEDTFLAVTLPTGQTAYTRAGNVDVDANRFLHIGGYRVGGPLQLPEGATEAWIDAEGQVWSSDAQGAPTLVGRLPLARFTNSQGLLAVGDNLFVATAASGPAEELALNGLGPDAVRAGFLESSNVSVADEMSRLIRAQRAYQANARAFRVWDELITETYQLGSGR